MLSTRCGDDRDDDDAGGQNDTYLYIINIGGGDFLLFVVQN